MTWTGPPADGGVTTRLLTVYFAEGWDVTVMVANAADTKDSPVLSPDVPLTLDQLREVAYSDGLVRVAAQCTPCRWAHSTSGRVARQSLRTRSSSFGVWMTGSKPMTRLAMIDLCRSRSMRGWSLS